MVGALECFAGWEVVRGRWRRAGECGQSRSSEPAPGPAGERAVDLFVSAGDAANEWADRTVEETDQNRCVKVRTAGGPLEAQLQFGAERYVHTGWEAGGFSIEHAWGDACLCGGGREKQVGVCRRRVRSGPRAK